MSLPLGSGTSENDFSDDILDTNNIQENVVMAYCCIFILAYTRIKIITFVILTIFENCQNNRYVTVLVIRLTF